MHFYLMYSFTSWVCTVSTCVDKINYIQYVILSSSQVALEVTIDEGLIPGLGRCLEEELATHSSILAWETPWTEEPGRLQSMQSQRAGHD